MTREEAIAILIREKDEDPFMRTEYREQIHEALSMGIKALEQEPCEDCISRDMALEKMADYVASGYANSAEDFEEYSRIICQLPPVAPKQRTGHWIMSDDGLCRPICDKCGAHPWKGYIPTVEEATEVFKYCPNCGAKMESEGVKKNCTTCILDGTDACVSGVSDDEVCEGYIAESEEQA